MNITIEPVHRNFFEEHGFIEFEELLSSKQIEEIKEEIKKGVKRDLWRGNPLFNKMVNMKQLAQIASELVAKKPLMLGYDQSLSTVEYQEGETLIEISCIQGIVCGVILCLEDSESDIFPSQAGNALFVRPDFEIPWKTGPYFMVVFTRKNAVYVFQEKDPFGKALKKLGYSYGDVIHNPIVCK